jgi:hypothetical protein
MNFVEDFLLPDDIPGKAASILLLLCTILLLIRKRNYNLISGLFIVAWFLSLLSIVNRIIYTIGFGDPYLRASGLIIDLYSALMPTLFFTAAIAGILIKWGDFRFMSQHRWFILFIMVAFFDVILVWYFIAYCLT